MLEARALSKHFALDGRAISAVRDVDLSLPRSSFTVLVGRSGCGKSTLLRLLAGLIEPSSGELRFGGATRPKVACVFQEPRLMPWLDVTRNVGFGIAGRLPRAEIAARIKEALLLVGLADFARAMPDQLSGGMASRVGLARALVMRPELLLLDEPFAALDALTRRGLQEELADIWLKQRPTVVFVTHDVEEAVLLGDTVLHMDGGTVVGRRSVDIGRPRSPSDPRVVALRAALLEDLREARRAGAPRDVRRGAFNDVPTNSQAAEVPS